MAAVEAPNVMHHLSKWSDSLEHFETFDKCLTSAWAFETLCIKGLGFFLAWLFLDNIEKSLINYLYLNDFRAYPYH